MSISKEKKLDNYTNAVVFDDGSMVIEKRDNKYKTWGDETRISEEAKTKLAELLAED